VPGPILRFPAVMVSHTTWYLTVLGKQNVGMTGVIAWQPTPTHCKGKASSRSRIDDEGAPDKNPPASGFWEG